MDTQEAVISSTVTTSKKGTYADLVIHYLRQIGVEYIFGVPGGAIEPLYNAIGRNLRQPAVADSAGNSLLPLRKRHRSERIYAITARHESGAAFMADGYTRETGRLGVCCATTGPGATNLITGVAAAYADCIPMLVITAQTALPSFGRLGFQESSSDAIDIVGMFEHCTRYNTLVSHPGQLEGKLYKALLHAFRHPRGPVHLSIPMDVLNAPCEMERETYQIAPLFRRPKTVDGAAYQALLKAVKEAKKMVIFAGGACKDFMKSVIEFAERTNTPIVTTPSGKGLINNYHPLYRGVFGFAGHESAYKTLQHEEVELVLAVGTPLGEMATGGWDKAVMNDRLIHLSAMDDDFNCSPMARLHVLGDGGTIFGNLLNDLATVESGLSLDGHGEKLPAALSFLRQQHYFSDAVPLKPQRVMYELMRRMPANSRYVVDAGNVLAWATHYLMLKGANLQRTSFGYGSMGWAIGAAVGTALGCRTEPVVCITGDGSYLMSGQELSVAVAERLPILFIVLNDQALGMVKHGQRMTGAESIGYELPLVDFAQIARAQGAQAHTIHTIAEFDELELTQMLIAGGPTLLDVRIDPEEVPPLDARIKALNEAHQGREMLVL